MAKTIPGYVLKTPNYFYKITCCAFLIESYFKVLMPIPHTLFPSHKKKFSKLPSIWHLHLFDSMKSNRTNNSNKNTLPQKNRNLKKYFDIPVIFLDCQMKWTKHWKSIAKVLKLNFYLTIPTSHALINHFDQQQCTTIWPRHSVFWNIVLSSKRRIDSIYFVQKTDSITTKTNANL